MLMEPGRKRARQACIACNIRRVKCNLAEQHPCHNCAVGGVSCQVRESRRGKHPRTGSRTAAPNPGSIASDTSRVELDDAAASQVLATLSQQHAATQNVAYPALQTPMVVANGQTQTDQQPVQENEHLEEADRSRAVTDEPETEQIEGDVFLGESTTLRYVHEDLDKDGDSDSSHESPKLLHHLPMSRDNDTQNNISELENDRRQAKLRLLREEGSFSFPEPAKTKALLRSYFRWFHSCFAIVDEPQFWKSYAEGTVSPLLLNAMLFISVIHSDEKTLGLDCGLAQAKFTFYSRAKDIYDADYESDKITTIQALFLLSCWRSGPFLEKDTRHWLAAAISLGQSQALHRCKQTGSVRDSRQERVRRRIWWCIYIRERQCAAALGLPNRIRDKDCDVTPLEPRDFEHAFAKDASSDYVNECLVYQIGMTELSRILGQIVHCGYLPGKSLTTEQKSSIRQEIAAWKSRLPESMQLKSGMDEQMSLRTGALHLASNNLVILLYRNDYIANADECDKVASAALQAASHNARIIEDLLPCGILRHAQVHAITNLFNTLCIHAINLRRATGPAAPIAEHRAKVCLLGLQELQQTWDVRNWILQLFFHYLDRSTAARLLAQGDAGRLRKQKFHSHKAQRVQRKTAQKREHAIKQQVPEVQSSTQNHSSPGGPWGGSGWGIIPDSPWSFSSDDQTSFLFSQIESDFAFGEGCNAYSLQVDGPSNTLAMSYAWETEELGIVDALS